MRNFISLTLKLITYFIDGFTSGMKFQSTAYLLSGRECIHGFCGLDNLQDCKDNFFEVGLGEQRFSVGFVEVFVGLPKGCGSRALALILLGDPFLIKLVGGASTSGLNNCGMKSSSIHDASQPQTHRAHYVIYIYDLSQLKSLEGVKVHSTYWWGGEGWKCRI
jgi:hypothetical protein